MACALASGSCHWAVEDAITDEQLYWAFDTDCPGSNTEALSPGLLADCDQGTCYRFWVETGASDSGTTENLDGDPMATFTYYQTTQSSSEVHFLPEPTFRVAISSGSALVYFLARKRSTTWAAWTGMITTRNALRWCPRSDTRERIAL